MIWAYAIKGKKLRWYIVEADTEALAIKEFRALTGGWREPYAGPLKQTCWMKECEEHAKALAGERGWLPLCGAHLTAAAKCFPRDAEYHRK